MKWSSLQAQKKKWHCQYPKITHSGTWPTELWDNCNIGSTICSPWCTWGMTLSRCRMSPTSQRRGRLGPCTPNLLLEVTIAEITCLLDHVPRVFLYSYCTQLCKWAGNWQAKGQQDGLVGKGVCFTSIETWVLSLKLMRKWKKRMPQGCPLTSAHIARIYTQTHKN